MRGRSEWEEPRRADIGEWEEWEESEPRGDRGERGAESGRAKGA